MTLATAMQHRVLLFLATCLSGGLLGASPIFAFEYLGSEPTKWAPGFNSAETHSFAPPDGPRSPGGASWSAMPSGVPFSDALGGSQETPGGGPHPVGDTNVDIEFLVTPEIDGLEYAIVNEAFNTWAAVASLKNLGQVADGAQTVGSGAVGDPDGSLGHIGDIRIGSFEFVGPDFDLAQSFQPGTEAIYGPGGTIAGDIHFNRHIRWIDDPNDPSAASDFDFFTVVLHELGHALGLGHSDVVDSVMHESYTGSRRSLHADDIAGIVALYGPPIPEPSTCTLALSILAGLGCRRCRTNVSVTSSR